MCKHTRRENNFGSKKQAFLHQQATYPTLEFTIGESTVYEIEFAKLSFHILSISHQLSVNYEMFQLEFDIGQLYVSTFQVERWSYFHLRKQGKGVKDMLVKNGTQLLWSAFSALSVISDSATKDYNLQINHCGHIFSCDIYDYSYICWKKEEKWSSVYVYQEQIVRE